MLSSQASLSEIREYFSHDRFTAKACRATIESAKQGYAVCKMKVDDSHKNALGGIMGGALFTLADFALAVASNIGETPTVAVNNSIQFLNPSQGEVLTAECSVDKSGRTLGFYTTLVTDDRGILIAKMTATCSRKAQ